MEALARGLSEPELAAARELLESTLEARKRRRRVLQFADGAEFMVGRATWPDLAAYIDTHFATDGVVDQLEVAAVPQPVGPREGTGGGGGEGSYDVGARQKMSEAERTSVGLVGELIAHAWLERRHGTNFNDDCWVSAYRRAHDLPEGNDKLGYDFRVEAGGRTILYEVKATTGDEPQFELGESEVRAASDSWATPGTEYVIVFVSQVLSPAKARLVMLPNPLDPDHRTLFRIGGSGLRCQFRLGDRDSPASP